MSLLAFNLTTTELTLAASKSAPVKLPPIVAEGVPAAKVNVTSEMQGLTEEQYLSIQEQVLGELCGFEWTGSEEYPTPGLPAPPHRQIWEVPISGSFVDVVLPQPYADNNYSVSVEFCDEDGCGPWFVLPAAKFSWGFTLGFKEAVKPCHCLISVTRY